jgi:branched-subunit amino acid ABC-type transport system permease component
LAQSFAGTYIDSAYVNAVAMLLLVVVLIARPNGLFRGVEHAL